MLSFLQGLLGIGGKAMDKLFPDRSKLVEKNLDINAETERTSGGAMTPRKLFMYILAFLFVWEVVGRPVIVTYWPHVPLPPSMKQEVMVFSSALFGLVF